jgi:hypothetical protein
MPDMFATPLVSDDSPPRHQVYYTPKRASTEIVQGLDALAPYADADSVAPLVPRYPGRMTLWRQTFPSVSIFTIYGWRSGRRKMPQWARDTLAAHLEREAITRLEIAKELRKLGK